MMHVQNTMEDINKEELVAGTSSNLLVGEKPTNREKKTTERTPKTAMELEQASSITSVQTPE